VVEKSPLAASVVEEGRLAACREQPRGWDGPSTGSRRLETVAERPPRRPSGSSRAAHRWSRKAASRPVVRRPQPAA